MICPRCKDRSKPMKVYSQEEDDEGLGTLFITYQCPCDQVVDVIYHASKVEIYEMEIKR
jgi:hypothetical protein